MILGKACDLIDSHQMTKQQSSSPKHEKGGKNEKPDKGSKNEKVDDKSSKEEKIDKTLKSESFENGTEKVEDLGGNLLKADEKNARNCLKIDHPNFLKESLPDVEDFSVGTSSVFFDNAPVCTASSPPFGFVESLSKSSSGKKILFR